MSKPILPDPCKSGWKLSEDIENCYEPIMADQKPAPVLVVELSFCSANMDVIQNVALAKKQSYLQ